MYCKAICIGLGFRNTCKVLDNQVYAPVIQEITTCDASTDLLDLDCCSGKFADVV